MERLRYAIRCRNYSGRTEKSYVFRVDRFLSFCRCGGLGEDAHSVRAFLERLVIGDGVSSATQAQALNALVFHFRHVACEPLGDLGDFQRSKRPRKLPVVLGREEVRRLLESIDPTYRLPAALMYGAGLRLLETLCLRVKDVDLERRQIAVRDGKGRRTG